MSGKSKALAKNTTRRGGDFLPRPERPRPCFCSRTRTTFAPEIKQKHTGSLIKIKREAIGVIMDKKPLGRKADSLGMNSKRWARKF
ncbi:hypothetical protein B0A68_12510 [Flavobacterium reichenbachii]|uniref:Uncharacterized protein n=1 Tax=Flavobacterium reichenbachii TaxID=362418 RepID=A0A085ZJ71_9FLAO|nr:hypothetical protein IW19_02595 [Flavobacterium reichenbachii]OXB14460.1 hypothetical protein B0A68_12510 [Flavobacterium reichenbachii]